MLMNSPRSTRGTARSTAYWKAYRLTAATDRPRPAGPAGSRRRPYGRPRHRRVRSDRVGWGRAAARRPGPARPRISQQVGGDQRRELIMDRARPADAGQHVVAVVVRRRGEGLRRSPGVMEAQAGAVVDRVQVAVPDQQVGVPRAAVDVGDERVQPDDPGGVLGHELEAAVVTDRSRQEVDREVQPGARRQQRLHLLVRLAAADLGVELDQRQLRDQDAEPPGRAPRPRSRRPAPSAPDPRR